MTNKGFITQFKKQIKGFDETKIWFEILGKWSCGGTVNICFVINGKLKRCQVYHEQFEIDQWKPHFEEFLQTGKFDFNGYWMLYDDGDGAVDVSDIGKVFMLPLCKNGKNDCYETSPKMEKFLQDYRTKDNGIHKNCGIQFVSKPA